MTAVHLSVVAGDVSMLRLLVEAVVAVGAPFGSNVPEGAAETPIFIRPEERGLSLDELCGRNKLGWCALHTAAFRGHAVAVRLLLDAGAPVNFPTADGCTALHLAAARSSGPKGTRRVVPRSLDVACRRALVVGLVGLIHLGPCSHSLCLSPKAPAPVPVRPTRARPHDMCTPLVCCSPG